MRKFLWLSLLAIGLGFGMAPTVRADQLFHTTISVTSGTASTNIPASTQCRITNPGSGYSGSLQVKFEPSDSGVPILQNLNLDSGAAPVTSFTPNAAASGYTIFPGTQGTLQFIGTGGSGSTTLRLDCNSLAPSIATLLPLPLPVSKGGTGVASPNPTVTAGACNSSPSISGWPSFNLSVPAGCQPSPLPSPQVTATACAAQPSVGAGGVISVPAGCSGGGGVNTVPSPTANPSPYPGYLQVTSGIYVGAAPTPAPGATAIPQAFLLQSTSCAPQSNIASWGTSASSLFGITGTVAALGCRAASPVFLVDTSGNVVGSTLIGSNIYSVQASKSDCPSSPLGAGTLFGCAGSNNQGAVLLGGTTSHCTVDWNKATTSYLTAACALNLSTSTKNNGEVICAVASAASCTTSAVTVRSGALCVASMNGTDTTVAGPYYAPVPTNASGSLTYVLTAQTAGTGNLAANYWCP